MSVVYAISDLHGYLPEVPADADALLIVGDICPDYRYDGVHERNGLGQSEWLNTRFRRWLEPVVERDCQVVVIWGNHDFVGEHPDLVPDLPWTLLQDSEVALSLPSGPLRVYGTPWVPGLPYWAFYAREGPLEARAAAIPDGLDVLMTHGPPYGAGDFIPTSQKQREKYGNFDGERVGDHALRARLSGPAPAAEPKAVVCGHIHEDRGQHGLPNYGGTVYNCAAVDGVYDPYPNPFVRLREF